MAKNSNGNGSHGREGPTSPLTDYRHLARELYERGPEMSVIERAEAQIATIRAGHDAGAVTDDEFLYIVARAIAAIVDERITWGSSPPLKSLSEKLRKIDWKKGDARADHEALNRQYNAVRSQLTMATFEEYGQKQLAAMYRDNRAEFDAARERGRRRFFEKDTRNA